MTVREITIIDVEPGRESDFAQAYRDQGRNLVLSTPGGEILSSSRVRRTRPGSSASTCGSRRRRTGRTFATPNASPMGGLLGPAVAGAPDVKHYENVTV